MEIIYVVLGFVLALMVVGAFFLGVEVGVKGRNKA